MQFSNDKGIVYDGRWFKNLPNGKGLIKFGVENKEIRAFWIDGKLNKDVDIEFIN